MIPIRRKLAAALLAALALAACSPPQPRDVTVKLDWSTDGVAIADGVGAFTTDIGYEVEADGFEVTAYSFELLPCEQAPPQPPQRQSTLSLIGTALAGHRLDHPPTLTTRSRVESPLRAAALTLETLRIPDVSYCSGHYLIARLPETGIDPADTANIDIALRAHGRFRKDAETPWTEFSVETPVSHGILVKLPAENGIRVENGDAIVLRRRLSTAFNGVDFLGTDQREIARQILRELVASATLVHQGAD